MCILEHIISCPVYVYSATYYQLSCVCVFCNILSVVLCMCILQHIISCPVYVYSGTYYQLSCVCVFWNILSVVLCMCILEHIISCPVYVYSATYAAASPLNVIHVSVLFIIIVVFFILICSPISVLRLVSSFTIFCSSSLDLAKKTTSSSTLKLVRIPPLILWPHLLLQFSF